MRTIFTVVDDFLVEALEVFWFPTKKCLAAFSTFLKISSLLNNKYANSPFGRRGASYLLRWLKSETAKRGNLGRVTIFFLMQELPWPLNPTGPSTTQKSDLLVCTNTRDISEEKKLPTPIGLCHRKPDIGS